MSQINSNFQELISNNNNNQSSSLDNVTGTAIISSETIQGFSMANQFAICANSGNGPVLLSCLTPMLLPTLTGTSKGNFELTNCDGRGQNQPQTVQIQLSSPFNLAGNLCNAQTLQSLGLSYINLSSLTNAGNSFPLQITLNNSSNNNGSHQLTIPTATLNSLNQEVQISQNYQVKFEPECGQQQQQQIQQSHQQQQQHTIVTRTQDISDMDDKVKRKPRRRIPNKSNKSLTMTSAAATVGTNHTLPVSNQQQPMISNDERLLDHKGRPFIYNCPHCPKKFTLNSRLTAHLRCHTGIRPYTCVQCGFSFTQKSYLIRHAAVHTEERPFTCERCLKTYKHYGSLANHRKLHRKEDKNDAGGGGCTSEISDADQKQLSCGDSLVTTTTTNNNQSNFNDNIIQLHSDWSTVVSSTLDNNNTVNSNNNTTYLITGHDNSVSSKNNNSTITAYYTANDSLSMSASSNMAGGSGPVAFPEQQLSVAISNQSLLLGGHQSFCASNTISNSIDNKSFIDHHHQQQQQLSSSNQNNTDIDSNGIIYTHVESQQQTYSATFTSTNTI